MRKTSLIAASLTLVLASAPAATVASAAKLPDPIAHAATQRDTPSPRAGARQAYGKDCATESRKHVSGHPGTPFSECVHALKTMQTGRSHTAKGACKAEPHRHVKGEKGTPFSRCVAAARKVAHAKHVPAGRHAATGPR